MKTVAFAGIIYLRLLEAGYDSEFENGIELSCNWLFRNRIAEYYPNTNLCGSFIETKVRLKKGKALVLNRNMGTSFAACLLADYHEY